MAAEGFLLNGTPNGEPILRAKLRPPVIRQPVLVRQRLLDQVSGGILGPLTLVSAPAGSGKSLLVSSWVSACRSPGRVAWLSLDQEDDHPGVFWTYVLAALADSGVPVSDIGVPETVEEVEHALLARLAVGLSEAAEPVVLVLDNVEVLGSVLGGGRGIADQVDFVLRHAAGQLRLVLISRTDPDLPLHQYRLEGAVTEIRFPDLAFAAEEARELLRTQDVEASDRAVLAFADRTRGWAAGLRLGGAELDRGDGVVLRDSDIAVYFRTEVLDAQPPEVRDFLLSTSVVERLPTELAVQLTGVRDASALLRTLAQAGVFIEESPDADGCFQYYPLVRDLLQAELRQESAVRQRRLNRRAARWLAAEGMTSEAVVQFTAAEDWREAARLLVHSHLLGDILVAGPEDPRVEVVAGIPAGTPGPEAALVCAALAWRARDLTSCEVQLARAEGLLAERDPAEDPRSVRLAVSLLTGLLACSVGDAREALAAASVSHELLSDLAAEGVVPPPSTLALVLWCAGTAHLGLGDLQKARGVLAAAGRTANVPGGEELRALCLAHRALAEALSGRLVQASETSHRAIALTRRRSATGPADELLVLPPAAALVALAWVSAERGDSSGARAYAEQALACTSSPMDPNSLGVLALIQGRLLRARGDLAGALIAVGEGRRTSPPVRIPAWLATRLSVAEAALLTAQGRVEEAIHLLRCSGASETPEGLLACGWALLQSDPVEAIRIAKRVSEQPGLPLDVRIGAILLTAAGDLEASRQEAARGNVEQALTLAEREGLRRPFEEVPPRLRMVLRGMDGVRTGMQPAGATPGGGLSLGRDTAQGNLVVQPLTDREREVLKYLDELLPTEEIAAKMFVSVNTVKTHVRAILRKLAADRRNDAVRRGRELGLL